MTFFVDVAVFFRTIDGLLGYVAVRLKKLDQYVLSTATVSFESKIFPDLRDES